MAATATALPLLPLGVASNGEPVGLDLNTAAHTLVAGRAGSGKSFTLHGIMAEALRNGFDVWLSDPIRGGSDFDELRPAIAEWADNLDGTAAQVQKAYAEVERRQAILKAAGAGSWTDLDEATREAESIRPILYVLDEYISTILPMQVAAAMKDTDLGVELEAGNAAKAVIKVYVAKLAREARSAGIHLVLAAQRPDEAYFGAELRANMGNVMYLAAHGRQPGNEAFATVFGSDPRVAAALLAQVNEGRGARGALIQGPDGELQAVRLERSA